MYQFALVSQRVLVYGDCVTVQKNVAEFRLDGPQVDGHKERCCEHRPYSHLGFGLLVTQAEIAYEQLKWETCNYRLMSKLMSNHKLISNYKLELSNHKLISNYKLRSNYKLISNYNLISGFKKNF